MWARGSKEQAGTPRARGAGGDDSAGQGRGQRRRLRNGTPKGVPKTGPFETREAPEGEDEGVKRSKSHKKKTGSSGAKGKGRRAARQDGLS